MLHLRKPEAALLWEIWMLFLAKRDAAPMPFIARIVLVPMLQAIPDLGKRLLQPMTDPNGEVFL